jgi:hypothetical protein
VKPAARWLRIMPCWSSTSAISNAHRKGRIPPTDADEPAALRRLREIHGEIDARSVIELYHEAQHH